MSKKSSGSPDSGEQRAAKRPNLGLESKEDVATPVPVPALPPTPGPPGAIFVWPTHAKGFAFPEQSNPPAFFGVKSDFAVCLSGGGYRASTCALGWMNALHFSGILRHAKYLSSNSGGSWFNAAFSYQKKVSVDRFLGGGPCVHPATLNPVDVGLHLETSYADTVAKANLVTHLGRRFLAAKARGMFDIVAGVVDAAVDGIVQALFPTPGTPMTPAVAGSYDLWSEGVGAAFLEPYDLHGKDSTFAFHDLAETVSGWLALKDMAGLPVHTACRPVVPDFCSYALPFPIMVSCLDMEQDPARFYPLEFTPLYSGVPAVSSDVADDDGKKATLGGVLVQPHGLLSDPPKGVQVTGWQGLDVGVPKALLLGEVEMFPLQRAAGLSSHALALAVSALGDQAWGVLRLPQLKLWNGVDLAPGNFRGVDGGATDNLAVFPPLRRGVKNLLICFAMQGDPSKILSESADAHTAAEKMSADGTYSDLTSLFGRVGKDVTLNPLASFIPKADIPIVADVFNKHVQVFPGGKLEELVAQLQAQYAKGGPLVARLDMDVMANDVQGVRAYTDGPVRTVWVINGGHGWRTPGAAPTDPAAIAPGSWGSHLSPQCLEALGKYPDFPYIATMKLDYEDDLVGYLSNLSAWCMRHPDTQELIAGLGLGAPQAAAAPVEAEAAPAPADDSGTK